MKGIILAGGSGSRLYPITLAVSKQLLPVYNKPMIYYPLSVLMLAGIREILIITTPKDLPLFKQLLGNGSQFGVEFSYLVQTVPNGIAEAFLIGKDFIKNDPVCLVLGDNIFFGDQLENHLLNAKKRIRGATLFGYEVKDPFRYGVVEFDKDGKALSIEEKPKKPKSQTAVTGLYFYDSDVVSIASSLKPSKRNELEITDLNCRYLRDGLVHVEVMGKGLTWLDAGTYASLLQAGYLVQTIEERQGKYIGAPEEVAYNLGFISSNQLLKLCEKMGNNPYGSYLRELL